MAVAYFMSYRTMSNPRNSFFASAQVTCSSRIVQQDLRPKSRRRKAVPRVHLSDQLEASVRQFRMMPVLIAKARGSSVCPV